MGRKLRTAKGWFSARNDARAQWVLMINGGAGMIAAFWGLSSKMPIAAAAAIGAAVFGGLTAALFHPRMAIVGMLAGSALVGVVAAFFGAAFCGTGVAAWVGGGVIGAGSFALTFWSYRRLVRSTTGAGDLEGRYVGTFNERDERMRKGSGAATVVVSATDEGDHDLRIAGLVVGGVSVELFGARREEETIVADIRKAIATGARFDLVRGKAILDGATLIVDLDGSPFGTYVFTGQRQRG